MHAQCPALSIAKLEHNIHFDVFMSSKSNLDFVVDKQSKENIRTFKHN